MRRRRYLVALLLLLATPAWAAITKNGTSLFYNSDPNGSSWTTGNFTINAGSDSILIVTISIYSATDPNVSLVKWGGSGGTSLTKYNSAIVNSDCEESIWYLVAPTAQTSTIYVEADGGQYFQLGATAYDGAAQTTPLSGFVTDSQWTASSSLAVTSAIGSVVVDSNAADDNITCHASQTADAGGAGAASYGTSHKAGAASVTMVWTTSGTTRHRVLGASLAAAAGATPTPTPTPTPKQLFIITGYNTRPEAVVTPLPRIVPAPTVRKE